MPSLKTLGLAAPGMSSSRACPFSFFIFLFFFVGREEEEEEENAPAPRKEERGQSLL